MKNEPLLTPRNVADRLSVSLRHIYNLIECGDLEAVNVGKKNRRPTYRIKKDAVEAFFVKRVE